MSQDGIHRGQVIWEKADFKKHGLIATYLLGECRCAKCVKRWESWDPYDPSVFEAKRQMLYRGRQ